jgi:hypothetical protein
MAMVTGKSTPVVMILQRVERGDSCNQLLAQFSSIWTIMAAASNTSVELPCQCHRGGDWAVTARYRYLARRNEKKSNDRNPHATRAWQHV